MGTNINIDVTLQRLQEQSRQALAQNRNERQAREGSALTSASAKDLSGAAQQITPTQGSPQRGSPFNRRRPAAFRTGVKYPNVFHLMAGYGRWDIFDYPNLDPNNPIQQNPDTPSYSGVHFGLELYPIYRPTADQPTRIFYAFEPAFTWTRNYELRGIERLNTFLLPIDEDRAVWVMYWQWRHAWVPEGTLTDVHTTHLKCALVTSSSVRELDPPARLRTELERLYPALPAPDKTLNLDIYDENGNYVESKSGLWDWTGRTTGEWDPINHAALRVVGAFGIGDFNEQGHRLDWGFDYGLALYEWANPGSRQLATDACYFSPGIYELLLDASVFTWCQNNPAEADSYADVRAQFIDATNKFEDTDFVDVSHLQRSTPGEFTFPGTRHLEADSGLPEYRSDRVNTGSGWVGNSGVNIKNPAQWPAKDPANSRWSNPQMFYATNWGETKYCISKLKELGFTSFDLTP